MMKKCILTAFAMMMVAHVAPAEENWLSRYNTVWTTPSQDSLDSMPLSGRFGAGANVWVQDGSIWLYLAHNGAYDEQGRLLKLGCVRITPIGVKLGEAGFRQTLDLATGSIAIEQGDFKASLWFAGETLLLESTSAEPKSLNVAFGAWRHQKLEGIRCDMMGARSNYSPDHIAADAEGFVWYHNNAEFPQDIVGNAGRQGIAADDVCDPTTRRVFGGAIAVDGGLSQPIESTVAWQFWEGKAWTGRTAERKQHAIAMRLAAKIDADPKQWKAEAQSALDPTIRKAAKADELMRWNEFWSRSHVVVNPASGPRDCGWLIGQNYQLFRYMLACNRGGELPLLFNGGIFTTDNNGRIKGNNNDELPTFEGKPVTPDFRRWMGCHFMSQNQRWLGWPTLAGGDADLLAPSLAFYRNRSAVAAARAKTNGDEGVVYPEPLDIWGLCCVSPRPDGLCGADHLTYHFAMMLEHAWMALQAHDTLGIPLQDDLKWIEGTVIFFDSFYRAQCKRRTGKELGDDGKLVIYPGNALEFARGATNAIEVVAGLTRITESLLRVPELPALSRDRLETIRLTLPELPIGVRHGRRSLLPARTWEAEYNKWEPIEMYALWPYRLAGITRPVTLQLARDTWDTVPEDRARLCKQDYSWMANVINMAALALPEKAKERAIYKMANIAAPQARFPAFFGPGHDWLPDHNWGGSGMTGIQEMILAPEPGPQGKLNLFPAWPAEWDVDFKLHAPGQTVVEGVLRGGKIENLKITPGSRAKDVVNWLGKQPAYLPPPPPLSQGKPVSASSTFDQPGYDPAKANDGDLKTRWASDFGARNGWLAIDLEEERTIGRVWISEVEWPETREFAIEIEQGKTWKEIARGTTIGADKEITFAPVKARHVRLHIFKAERPININEFQIFGPASITATPAIQMPAAETVIVRPAKEDALLVNPSKGYVQYYGTDDKYTKDYIGVIYTRWPWNALEPTEGEYRWDCVDQFIAQADKYGKKAAIAVMSVSTGLGQYVTPKWVFDAGAKSMEAPDASSPTGTQIIPESWEDPVFLAKMHAFIAAFGKRYDGNPKIAFVDIRDYGNWGEGHIGMLGNNPKLILTPADNLQKNYLLPYFKAFPHTQLIVVWGSSLYDKPYDWAVSQGAGMRRDGILSEYSKDGSECLRAYGHAPAVFEYCNGYDETKKKGYWSTDSLWHYVDCGKPTYMQWNPEIYEENKEFCQKLGNRVGYHFVLQEAEIPAKIAAGVPFPIQLKWLNDGVAPLYEPCHVAVALLDQKNQVVQKEWLTESKPKGWLPDERKTETIQVLFPSIPDGAKKVAIGLFLDKKDASPAYKLGIQGRTAEGWYVLSDKIELKK